MKYFKENSSGHVTTCSQETFYKLKRRKGARVTISTSNGKIVSRTVKNWEKR